MADSGQGFIKSSHNQFVKTFSVYDGQSRLVELYEAPADLADAGPCTVTLFEYDGTSTRVLKSKEEKAAWDASWDIT